MTPERARALDEQARRAIANLAAKEAALATAAYREPCFRCGVRYEMHEAHGCRRFTA